MLTVTLVMPMLVVDRLEMIDVHHHQHVGMAALQSARVNLAEVAHQTDLRELDQAADEEHEDCKLASSRDRKLSNGTFTRIQRMKQTRSRHATRLIPALATVTASAQTSPGIGISYPP